MKIAIVFDAFGYGGAEKVGCNYARLMNELGHDVSVINLSPKQNEMRSQLPKSVKYYQRKFSQYLCPDYYYILVKAFWWGKLIFPLLFVFLSLINLFRRIAFRWSLPSFDLGIAFAGHINDMSFVGKRFVRTKHRICWFHGAIYQKFLYSDAYVFLCKKMDEIIVLNEESQEQTFCANHFMKRFRVRKIYNPIYLAPNEIDSEYVSNIKNKYGTFLVMSARLSYPHKDHFTVIKALQLLKNEYGFNFNLVLLGDGPDKDKIASYAKECGVDNQVFFIGNVENVQDYYKASFALVHASVAGEGLPTVLLEAMACGVPVVSTDSSVGPREIIGNNEYGLLCEIKNPKDMAEKIVLLTNEANYHHYVKKGLERIGLFDPENIKNSIIRLLKDYE